ncbi:MAG: hypothetical protein MUP71_10660 [Candidatus Aminicenantes bacterium]|nr:hypothetical protein [Candidatus Aminicenantes bacterium]
MSEKLRDEFSRIQASKLPRPISSILILPNSRIERIVCYAEKRKALANNSMQQTALYAAADAECWMAIEC